MPIRRHPALAPLSRDHHRALQLACAPIAGGSQHLRAQLPRDLHALVAHVQKVFAEEIERHFAVEEASVLTAMSGRSAALDAECAEISVEHDTMRVLVSELGIPADGRGDIELFLDRLGTILEAHVRKEEGTLYEHVQTTLADGELAALAADVTRQMAR